jgi:catechol 2,3-dioxygenase-like lactoylglutathione lyase family enzyme
LVFFSHFGILVHDADAATKLWTEAFGLQMIEDRRIEVEGIRSVFVSVGGT